MLERSAGKLARSVLRGPGEREPTWLPGDFVASWTGMNYVLFEIRKSPRSVVSIFGVVNHGSRKGGLAASDEAMAPYRS